MDDDEIVVIEDIKFIKTELKDLETSLKDCVMDSPILLNIFCGGDFRSYKVNNQQIYKS